jgi:predicted neuraminidase
MGQPLTKTTFIELANDIVANTEYASKIIECKKMRKLNDTSTLGAAWYHGFMNCFEDTLTQNHTTVKEIKRRTWATRDILKTCMITYKAMVEAEITEELEEEVNYQLNDGQVGGEVFIMPKNCGDVAACCFSYIPR